MYKNHGIARYLEFLVSRTATQIPCDTGARASAASSRAPYDPHDG
jgi:hypothetical protein